MLDGHLTPRITPDTDTDHSSIGCDTTDHAAPRPRPIPGAEFGEVPLPPRRFDAGMGVAVARRTVFRKSDNEDFGRVADRVALGNMSLLGDRLTPDQQIERARLRNAIASGALLTSGRHLQQGDETQNTRSIEVFSNCASAITSFTKFYLLLNGAGVGRSYDDELVVVDWHQAPTVLLYLSPEHPDYPHSVEAQCRLGVDLGLLPHDTREDPDGIMRRYLDANLVGDLSSIPAGAIYHRVGDSREGWAKALEILEAMTFRCETTQTLVIDYSAVRAKGMPIGGMQNRPASGPLSIMSAFLNLRNHIIRSATRLPLWEQALRADHYFSVEVQVGGARRAARMATKNWRDPDIFAFIQIKSNYGLWSANHSVMVDTEFWELVNTDVTEDHWSQTAHAVFDEVTRCAFINGEPGFINGDALEDNRTGFAWQKPIHVDGRDFCSSRYQSDEAAGLLAELAHRASVSKFPVTTNPCVTADTWILTSGGPRQVADLIDQPFIAIVDGKPYPATGFWKTGIKPVFRLKTDRGYDVRATANHKFLVQIHKTQTSSVTAWKELSEITPGDMIILANHRSLQFDCERNVEFNQGWLLGQAIGNGGCGDDINYRAYVRFWGEQKVEMAERALAVVDTLPRDYHFRIPPRDTVTDSDQYRLSVASKRLTNLSYGLIGGNKTILPELEMADPDFVRGFLCGFFDADGTVASNNSKGSSVRLSQSDVPRLQAVQRMLARFGIISSIYEERNSEGERSLPDGKGGHALYYCKATNDLVISRDNIDRFAELIGFTHWEKASRLQSILDGRTRTPYRETFTATVESIEFDGSEMTFDTGVDQVRQFDANGIVAHNCGEVTLHVTGGVCVIADFAPLLACPVPLETLIPGQISDDIALEWDARVEASVRLGVRLLIRTNMMDALYHEEIGRTNRIGIGPTGLHDYAWMRFGFDFNDLLDESVSAPFWEMLERFSAAGKDEGNLYSDELELNRPVTSTTIKPSGTCSKLFGLTEGAHLPARLQYLRWVQFKGIQDLTTKTWELGSDPLLARYSDLGYPMKPLKSFPGMTAVGFPTVPLILRLGIGQRVVTANDASPTEQYQWLRLLEHYWIGENQGNQISYTMKVMTDRYDLETFREIVRVNQPTIRCCAVLPSRPDAELGYEYLPEEQVSLDRFAEIVSNIKDSDVTEEIDLVHLQCASGICPIV